MIIPSLLEFVWNMVWANIVFGLACLCIFLAAAQACMPLVGFYSMKQLRHLYGLILRSEDSWTVSRCGATTKGNTDEHLFTLWIVGVIHINLQAGGTNGHTNTHSSKHTTFTMVLIYNFPNIRSKLLQGQTLAPAVLFCVKWCEVWFNFNAPLKATELVLWSWQKVATPICDY